MTELRAESAAFVTRRLTSRPPELRDVGGAKHIVGYASVFNKMSRNLGGFVERIDRGTFDQAMISGFPGTICRYNHDDNYLLGTTSGQTLSLNVDNIGLYYDVNPITQFNWIVELCGRGDVTQSSFAFRVPDGGDYWERSGPGGMPLRCIISIGEDLVDVAPVNTPAYTDATASVRSIDNDLVLSLARQVGSDMPEVRSYLDTHDNNVAKFFKRSDTPPPAQEEPALPAPVPALAPAPGTLVTSAVAASALAPGVAIAPSPVLPPGAYWIPAAGVPAAERAAKATYSDLETCGDCGSQNEYGKYCSGCGAQMGAEKAKGTYCTSCGGKMPATRSEHVCETEERKKISAADKNDLPDSDFAFIEPGGTKDEDGMTTPRSLRHFPIHDAAHVRNALSQAPKSPFGAKALPKIKAAAQKFGISVEEQKHLILASLTEMRDALLDDEELRGELPPWLKKTDDDSEDDDSEGTDEEKDAIKSGSKKSAKAEKNSADTEAEDRSVTEGEGDEPAEEDEEELALRAAAAERAEYEDLLRRQLNTYPELEELDGLAAA